MTRIKFLFSFIALIISNITFSQNTHTLVTIQDKNYSIGEFDFIYNKNNSYTEDPKSKKEYVDLFVNYKLKVHEAIAQGLDTLPSFKKEYNYYKDELAKPYLSDKSITEHLKKEAYERLKQEVNASHILIKLSKSPTPEDTLQAYNKIKSIKERIKNGEDFNQLAKEFSDDPSAKKNMGKLGFFSGFMMVYPFESAAYNTPVNQVSDIIRTSFGYHIIKVHEKRENRGELRTAHIMMMFPPNSPKEIVETKKVKIDSIYQLVLKGEDFGSLAQNFSEDKRSAKNNGELPWFGSGRMIPEYSEPAFLLDSIGSVSKVIRTPYGFHIIKLLEKRGIKSYDEMEDEITKKISRDERAFKGKQSVINRLKKEYNYKQDEALINNIKEKAKSLNISDYDFYNYLNNTSTNIASFSSKKLKTKDLITYLKANKQFTKTRKAVLIDQMIKSFLEDEILSFEKTQLVNKYPEYKYLLSEYHDGLLIFEISQKEIWNKASQDSTGIKNYYNKHKNDYFEPEKIVGTTYFTTDKKTLNTIKSQFQISPNITNDSIKQIVPSKNLKYIKGEFHLGEYAGIDKEVWNIRKSKGKTEPDFPYVFTSGKTFPKKYKKLEETKGQVISDYQNELEKQWINELREKYNPVINTKSLKFSKNK